MNTAPCVFQFLTDKIWWKNVNGSWGLAGGKPHVWGIRLAVTSMISCWHLSNEKSPGCLGMFRVHLGLHYPFTFGLWYTIRGTPMKEPLLIESKKVFRGSFLCLSSLASGLNSRSNNCRFERETWQGCFAFLKEWQICLACVEEPFNMFKERAITNRFTVEMLSQRVLHRTTFY